MPGMSNPTISIITVSFNSIRTLADTINSVLAQTYQNIEYIVIDGSSTDGTADLVKSFGNRISKFISEPDNGIYDAINKGIKLSTGDVVGIINSDDFFSDAKIIEKVAKSFEMNEIDAVFGDACFVDPVETSRIVRYYSSKKFNMGKFRFGFMPAHPSFYVRRELFDKLGYYRTDYKIAADFELLLRFLLINRIRYRYLEIPFVSMRTGGVSNRSVFSNFILNREISRACRENGIRTNYLQIYSKYFTKIFEYLGNNNTRNKTII
jgi:glycosyltransferase involved in cell wall biosynthesis